MNPALRGSACREKLLLADCAHACVESEIAARLCKTAAGPLDWDYVLAQAREHSILPLVEHNLRPLAEAVPAPIMAQFEAAARANALRCLAQVSELLRVVDLLESLGIRALPYKGPVIAAQAYGDITARQFADLDIILEQRDVRRAGGAVREIGYAPRYASLHSPDVGRVIPGEYTYVHPARQTILEFHTEATLRHFPVPPRLSEFLERAVNVDLGGRSVRTFCLEDALPVYCIHGTKDFWERLIWIADIAELLRSFPNTDWDSVWRTAETLRADRMLHLGLSLAADVLDAKFQPEVLARVRKDSNAQALASEITRRFLARDTHERSARQRFRYRRDTVPGMAAGWRYALRLTFAPAEEDWEQTQIPPALAPFHAALRPFRLLRKYGPSHRSHRA